MLGKTHAVVGIAAGLLVLPPQNFRDLVIGIGASALGALISDIDVGTSEAHREANIVTGLAVVSVLTMVVAEWIWHLGIYNVMMRNTNVGRIVIGLSLFIGICAFGKEQPHRSFMHSLTAFALLSGCVFIVFPMMAPYFAVGFLSHLATDLLNYKRVKLFYPLKKGWCLKFCHAHGLANTVLFMVGAVVAGVTVGFRILHLQLR